MLAIIIGIVALLAWMLFFLYLRNKQDKLTTSDRVVGFLLFGPFFWSVEGYLKKRQYEFSRREIFGFVFLVLFVFAAPPTISWLIGWLTGR